MAIELTFGADGDEMTYAHRVEEELGTARSLHEAEVLYRVVRRHPVEGARVVAWIARASWSVGDGPAGRWQPLAPTSVDGVALEIAGGG